MGCGCRMQDETARVEDVLLEKSASDSLVRCFVQASGVSFEGILDPCVHASLTSPCPKRTWLTSI